MPSRVPHCFLLHFPSLCEAGARQGLRYARRGARGTAPHGGSNNPLSSVCGTCGHPRLQEPQVHSRQKPLPWGGGVRPPGSGKQGPSGCRGLGTTIPQCTGPCHNPEASVRTKREPARPWWASLPSRPLYTWGQRLSVGVWKAQGEGLESRGLSGWASCVGSVGPLCLRKPSSAVRTPGCPALK